MTKEEAIYRLKNMAWLYGSAEREQNIEAIDMAIEALSAPQTDIISRADAIEAVGDWMQKEYGYLDLNRAERLIDALSTLPSADAPYMFSEAYMKQLRFERDYLQDVVNGQWIPCSERLPKEKQEVYVTVYFIEGDTGRAYGYIDGFGKWHLCSTVEGTLNSGYEVIAWMPLPRPYKGGDDK